MNEKLYNYLKSGKYLPEILRDFHDQKNLFKSMHYLYMDTDHNKIPGFPNWVNGQIYVIDWFLWFMASRGYTLQKSRSKQFNFADWPDYHEILLKEFDNSDKIK